MLVKLTIGRDFSSILAKKMNNKHIFAHRKINNNTIEVLVYKTPCVTIQVIEFAVVQSHQ